MVAGLNDSPSDEGRTEARNQPRLREETTMAKKARKKSRMFIGDIQAEFAVKAASILDAASEKINKLAKQYTKRLGKSDIEDILYQVRDNFDW